MPSQPFVWSKRELMLLAALLLAPALAAAALAPNDLAGTLRVAPTTIGALEVAPAAGNVLSPAGLVLTVQRVGS